MKLKVHNVMSTAKLNHLRTYVILFIHQTKWSSILYHVQNVHEWHCGCCDHEPLTGLPTSPDRKELEYFSQYETAFKALQKLIMDKQWLKSMKYYVKFQSVANSSVIVVLCV